MTPTDEVRRLRERVAELERERDKWLDCRAVCGACVRCLLRRVTAAEVALGEAQQELEFQASWENRPARYLAESRTTAAFRAARAIAAILAPRPALPPSEKERG